MWKYDDESVEAFLMGLEKSLWAVVDFAVFPFIFVYSVFIYAWKVFRFYSLGIFDCIVLIAHRLDGTEHLYK